MNKEIIYVLTNSAMEGYVKIGRTTNLDQRLSSLDNTSVPLPFECVFAIEVEQGLTGRSNAGKQRLADTSRIVCRLR